jgi:invasion protein IalB
LNNAGWDFNLPRFLKTTMAALAIAALSLPVVAIAQETANPAVTVKATYGDWDIVCPTAQPDQCTMRQFGKTAEGQTVLVIHIRKLEGITSEDGKTFPAAIQITTPLGTILRAGVKIKIDEGEPRTGRFEVCIPNGCIIRDPMSEEFLADFKSGKTANMAINVLQQGVVVLNISLKGFTKAFKKL